MKKSIGTKVALYPMPIVVIGAMKNEKPTWTLAGHTGIIGHDRVMISLASRHFINGAIKETRKLSVNLVKEAMLPKADYAGSVSGEKEDKSDLFDFEIGQEGAPVIPEAPITMECSVDDIYFTPNFESFICKIDSTYVDEGILDKSGRIDYRKWKPVLFEFPTYEYIRSGEVMGKCLSFHSEVKP